MAQFPTTKGPRRQYHLVQCSQKNKVCDNLYLISRIYVFVHWNGKKKKTTLFHKTSSQYNNQSLIIWMHFKQNIIKAKKQTNKLKNAPFHKTKMSFHLILSILVYSSYLFIAIVIFFCPKEGFFFFFLLFNSIIISGLLCPIPCMYWSPHINIYVKVPFFKELSLIKKTGKQTFIIHILCISLSYHHPKQRPGIRSSPFLGFCLIDSISLKICWNI